MNKPQLIVDAEMLQRFGARCGSLDKFANEHPDGVDIGGLWGTKEEQQECWLSLLTGKWKLHIAWAIGVGLLPSRIRADLSGADLREVNLSWANLRRAKLSRADLRWACLHGADLSWANLEEANLEGAILTETNLREANLRRAELRRADLSAANLRGANLNGAGLFQTLLWKTDLRGASLEDVIAIGVDLSDALLNEGVLERLRADYAREKGPRLERLEREFLELQRG